MCRVKTASFLVELLVIWGWGAKSAFYKPFVLLLQTQFSDLSNICPCSIQMLSFLFLRGIADLGGEELLLPFFYVKLFLPLPVSCL